MADTAPQSFDNHARRVPWYVAALGILIANVVWSTYHLVRYPSGSTVMTCLVAVALVLVSLYARSFALTVQNRVIRLEMRLRLKELLPADLHARIGDFTPGQLVALRFASDAELPALCRTVLADNLSDQKAIKKMIKQWQADHLRA
jgi:hypothetical protein